MTERSWLPRTWEFLVKYGPAIAVILGAAWTTLTWLDQRSHQYAFEREQRLAEEQRRKDAAGAEEQRRKEASRIAIRESQKPFLERQLIFYFEAAKVAAKLATQP